MEIAHHVERCLVRWGGSVEDYEDINTFIDSSKLYLSDWRHRVLLHSTLGVFFVEELFPRVFYNQSGKLVTARTVAEKHILEDLGIIPTPAWVLRELPSKRLGIKLCELSFLTAPELRLIQKIELLAKNKSYLYYTDLGLDIFTKRFGLDRFDCFKQAFNVITKSSQIISVEEILVKLPTPRWLAGLNANQIKGINNVTRNS